MLRLTNPLPFRQRSRRRQRTNPITWHVLPDGANVCAYGSDVIGIGGSLAVHCANHVEARLLALEINSYSILSDLQAEQQAGGDAEAIGNDIAELRTRLDELENRIAELESQP